MIFEPYYENYGPDSLLCGANRKFVRLHAPDWKFDPDELRRAFSPRTKAIIINTPHNPTGCVFNRKSLELIAELCQEFDALAITDEIYEHIVYDDAEHVPIMQLPGMRDRTILINSMSKTYGVTGWRVGWVLASPDPIALDSQSARLSDSGCGGSFAGRRSDRARPAGWGVLYGDGEGLFGPSRPDAGGAGRRRFPSCFPSPWRVLHHDGHLGVRIS